MIVRAVVIIQLGFVFGGSALAAPAVPASSSRSPAVETPAPQAAAAPATVPAGVPEVLALARPTEGEWFGLYILGKKAGYAFMQLKAGRYEGRPAVVETSRVTLKVQVGGAEAERRVFEERYFEPKDGGRLLGFRVEKHGDGGNEVLVGRSTLEGIRLLRQRTGQPDEVRHLPSSAERVETADPVRLALKRHAPVEGMTLDLEDDLADQRSVTEPLGGEQAMVAGVAVPVQRTRTVEQKSQIPVLTTVAADGRVLEIRFGEVMEGRAESEEIARRLDKVDLFTLTRVVLPARIPPEPRQRLEALVYEITGLPAALERVDARQKFAELSGGRLELTVTPIESAGTHRFPVEAPQEPEVARALQPSLAVESKAPAIVELARRLTAGQTDTLAAARKLNAYVFRFLEKTYGTSNDRATDVLKAKKGDCTEHSLLLTALCRAVGIPARRVDGLVYMDSGDGVPAFYWHEWVEVWAGGWVALDPTFDQPLADGAHIALGEEGRSDAAGLIGQLKIKWLSARPVKPPSP